MNGDANHQRNADDRLLDAQPEDQSNGENEELATATAPAAASPTAAAAPTAGIAAATACPRQRVRGDEERDHADDKRQREFKAR